MADDTKYKDIFFINSVNQATQLFAIDRDFKLWTMYMTGNGYVDWQTFTMPGSSGGVVKITGSPGRMDAANPVLKYFPRLWAIDMKNDLWSCQSERLSPCPAENWTSWTEWVAPWK
jgi:hypothetical protein